MELVRRTYAETSHVEVHSFIPSPAGPHPRGSFEVLFKRNALAEFVIWLMFFRPESLDLVAAGTVGAIPVEVDFVEELGSDAFVYGSVPGSSDTNALPPGEFT